MCNTYINKCINALNYCAVQSYSGPDWSTSQIVLFDVYLFWHSSKDPNTVWSQLPNSCPHPQLLTTHLLTTTTQQLYDISMPLFVTLKTLANSGNFLLVETIPNRLFPIRGVQPNLILRDRKTSIAWQHCCLLAKESVRNMLTHSKFVL